MSLRSFFRLVRSKGKAGEIDRRKVEVKTLTNWEPLIMAVMQHVPQFDVTNLFMIRFRNPKSKHVFGEHPTLLIGGLDPVPASKDRQVLLFIHAYGLIGSETVSGTEQVGWEKAGFDVQKSKKGNSFTRGPVSLTELPAALLSALDVFEMFYGVTERSSIAALGDPGFEQILNRTPGMVRRPSGNYQLI
jgi:hypothetical protein